MKPRNLMAAAAAALLLVAMPASAQQFEAVHLISFDSSDHAKAAMGALMRDPAMKGAKVTLYASDFGIQPTTHLIVQDFTSYADYMDSTARREASPGWTKYLLETQDSRYLGSNLAMVLDDYGAPRRTAGYLAAYMINTSDGAAYRAALAELAKAIGNPGVMRLVQLRTGDMSTTHVVLIGGADFKAVNEFIDKLNASDAYAKFAAKVGGMRRIVGLSMYRRVATWGD